MNRKEIPTVFLIITVLFFSLQLQAADPTWTLCSLKPLAGKWVGKGEGKSGKTGLFLRIAKDSCIE